MTENRTTADRTTGVDGAAGIEPARLRWLCRRGMKELDDLLARYLDRRYAQVAAVEREAFARLLQMQDPDIHALLIGRAQSPDAGIADVVECIRQNARS